MHLAALHQAPNQQVNPELRTDHARGVVLIRGPKDTVPDVVENQLSVVGKMQTSDALDYWWQKIGPAQVVMDWLMNGVLLYPRGALVIATQSVPKQYVLSVEQEEWVQKELDRLVTSSAVVCLGNQSERPDFLLEISQVFLVPKKGPKKWKLVIDLRRLDTILPEKSVRLEGLGSLLRTRQGLVRDNMGSKDGYHHVMMR